MKKLVRELPDDEAKTVLFHIFLRAQQLDGTAYAVEEFAYDVKKMYRTMAEVAKGRSNSNQDQQMNRIHILFGDSPAGSLRIALKRIGVHKVEKIISFWNIFSIGPISRLHEKTGMEARFAWMKKAMNIDDSEFHDYTRNFKKTVAEIISIPNDLPITIWTAENSHEQTGLRYVLYLLKDKVNDIQIINTTKLHAAYFNRPDLKYIVLHSGEIAPEKLQFIYEKNIQQPSLSNDDRQHLVEEWLTLSENHEGLRIWRNGKILSVSEDFYDQFIINMAKKLHHHQKVMSFMKSARLIGDVLGHLDQYVGDGFLENRLRKLIEAGIFDIEGSLKAMRYYSIKLK